MKNNNLLEEWLSEPIYLHKDVYDDNFAINFEKIARRELIGDELLEELRKEGLSLVEDESLEDLPF